VKEREPLLAQLLRGGLHAVGVRDLELDARLRHRSILWPLRGAEARLCSLGERPNAEARAALYVLAMQVVVRLALGANPSASRYKLRLRPVSGVITAMLPMNRTSMTPPPGIGSTTTIMAPCPEVRSAGPSCLAEDRLACVRAGSRSAVWAPQDRDGQKQVLLPTVENAALAPSTSGHDRPRDEEGEPP
jgi:hypothetical protein